MLRRRANKNRKQQESTHITGRRRVKRGKKIFLAIIVIGLIFILGCIGYLYSKFAKLNFEKINKDDLEVNSDLYDELGNGLSKNEFKDVKSIVFFGVDTTDSAGGFSGRSDTIMIVSINPKNKALSLVSIPRDTYVNIPGRGMDKINHAYAFGREQLAIKTINSNFGLNITEYVTIDFVGLINVINKVGGVQLNITSGEKNYINELSHESYKMSGNSVKKVTSTGLVTLTGEQALTHSRNRTIGNDFERAGRQRTVIEALLAKISSGGTKGAMNAIDNILPEVKTNINVASYTGTLTKVMGDKDAYLKNMVSSQVPSAEYSGGKTINSIYYYVTDMVKAKQDFIKKIYGE